MSSAKARRHSSSTIAWPPYLITTTLPWNSLSHGSAPVRTATFARVALGVVGAHDPAGADLLRQPPLGRGLVDPDVGRRRVLVAAHVEYAEFSWT